MSNQTEKRTTRDQLVTIGDLEQLKVDLAEIIKQLLKSGNPKRGKALAKVP